MGDAKQIVVRPISATDAREVVQRVHYSGKVVQNSTLHLGVFYLGRLEGAMQFGSPLDRRKVLPLVRGTLWNQMLELNRMAFSEALPRNSESRALGVAFRVLAKHRPDIKWILSFADGAQCGDGTIYRASGFVLTAIKNSTTLWRGPERAPSTLPDRLQIAYRNFVQRHGNIFHQMTLQGGERPSQEQQALKDACYAFTRGSASSEVFKALGCEQIPGYQFRYIRFIDPGWVDRLTVPVIPFDQIPEECRMYRGEKRRAGPERGAPDQGATGGADPTPALHPPKRPA